MAFSLFSVFGIEIEYMIVNREDLNIHPIADVLLEKLAGGELINEVECGDLAVSNELALHVIELKTNGPKQELALLSSLFHEKIRDLNQILQDDGACLMPTGAHPWYNPHLNMKLWPHGDKTIYNMYHSLFNCEGHGWSNLQSIHINLPFASDDEFSRLHNAIRLLMPVIPALTASTPIIEEKLTGFKDTRLFYYGNNQKKIPSISGFVVPEFIDDRKHYHEKILNPMYQAVEPVDPQGILQHEWLNSRGAIARFDRDAIEIRIVDTQECALADIACVFAITAVLQFLVHHTHDYQNKPLETKYLKLIYDSVIRDGLSASLEAEKAYTQAFGLKSKSFKTARHFWGALLEKVTEDMPFEYQKVLEQVLIQGNLAERLLSVTRNDTRAETLKPVYAKLCECLDNNYLFLP